MTKPGTILKATITPINTYEQAVAAIRPSIELKAPKLEVKPAYTMSGETLDEIIENILDADLDDTVEIPRRLKVSINYGKDLVEQYRPEDLQWVERNYIANFTHIELTVLDALCKWTFRNTGDLMRSAVGLLGAALSKSVSVPTRDHQIEAVESGTDISDSLMAEPVWTIRRLIQTSTSGGAIDAKIPMRTLADVFNTLSEMPKTDRVTPMTAERTRLSNLMTTVHAYSQLSESSMSREDFAVGRLIQMTKSVAQYKREEGFCRLRSFLTNGSMVASMIRVKSRNNPSLSRLCGDTLDILHSIDRLLNSNCVAANTLLERMMRSELVYDEIIAMGRHQHRIMAVEFVGAITMFSYLLKQSSLTLYDDQDVRSAIKRLLNYSGISEQYGAEIVSKQFRPT